MTPTHDTSPYTLNSLRRDLTAGLVVFLVALPLCLGVALASDAPLFSGVLAGIVGGIIVGALSGSKTSVSGPAAGLTAIVSAQIASLGAFETFLLAVTLAGVVQLVLGFLRAGFIAAFVPTSVIKGLLAAIGVILILKQIPHVVGHDPDPAGEMSFEQPDKENTFTELVQMFGDIHVGAAVIGLASLLLLVLWDRSKLLKSSPIPVALIVVAIGIGANLLFRSLGEPWAIEMSHLVNIPVPENFGAFLNVLQFPDFTQIGNRVVYVAAFTIAAVASLETLLNLEAVDKLDPQQRNSPPSRELLAQGVGNIVCGMIGGLPVTSVIIRSSVNINSGGQSKLSTLTHGVLLLVSVSLLPSLLNLIPLSCLAAILLVTGVKLASPKLARQMWNGGWSQFLPFMVTVLAIVFTDLLIGILIGLGVSICFILWSNVRRPLRRIVEKHLGGEVIRLELASQVSFLNRAALIRTLDRIQRGEHVLIDAEGTTYIDPDIMTVIREFKEKTGPARGIEVSLKGFRSNYEFSDETLYVDYSTRELQETLTPQQVLEILMEGNERFRTGQQLTRNLSRQMAAVAGSQHPLAVVLSCIDSRTPVELIFDLGFGDTFSVRVAGNVTSHDILGSIEYSCAVAGAKLVLVMGHTRCGAVTSAVDLMANPKSTQEATGCQNLDSIIETIQESVNGGMRVPEGEKDQLINEVARKNVTRSVTRLREQSEVLNRLVETNRIAIVGAMYDIATGTIEVLEIEDAA